MNAYHSDTRDKQFHCQICQKKFSTKTNFNKHCKNRHGITISKIRKQSSVKSKVTETNAMTNPLETAPLATNTMTFGSGVIKPASSTPISSPMVKTSQESQNISELTKTSDIPAPVAIASFSFGTGATSLDGNQSPTQSSFGIIGQQTTTLLASVTPGTINEKSTTTKMGASSLVEQLKPKPGAWSFKSCYTLNTAELEYCVSCEEPKYDTVSKKGQATNLFAPNGKLKF